MNMQISHSAVYIDCTEVCSSIIHDVSENLNLDIREVKDDGCLVLTLKIIILEY